MRILVTGAAGFIGSHLCDELLSCGHAVTGLDNLRNGSLRNLESASANPNFRFIQGDILSQNDCRSACEGQSAVFHLACLGVRHSLHSPFENHRVNAEGTLQVLQAACDLNVQRFFYISTSEVYGRTDTFPIAERCPTVPTTVYGASKLAGEHYSLAFREAFGLQSTVFRIFNNYGPRSHFEGDAGEMIPRSIVRLLNGQPPVVFGDGRITRDFFFVRDTARILGRMLAVPGIEGATINIGTGLEISMRELAEQLVRTSDSPELAVQYLEDRPADVPRLWVDNTKLRSMMSLGDLMPFADGLVETWRYFSGLDSPENLLRRLSLNNWAAAAEKSA
jgi:UDP-glucose 4-epimerase